MNYFILSKMNELFENNIKQLKNWMDFHHRKPNVYSDHPVEKTMYLVMFTITRQRKSRVKWSAEKEIIWKTLSLEENL
jgi:hypothetical protein